MLHSRFSKVMAIIAVLYAAMIGYAATVVPFTFTSEADTPAAHFFSIVGIIILMVGMILTVWEVWQILQEWKVNGSLPGKWALPIILMFFPVLMFIILPIRAL